jgi:hypothetical protein
MSLISSGVSLTHRCTIERDQNAGSDDGWGNPLPPDWQEHIFDLRCRAWTAGHETITDKGTLTVLIEVQLIVPLGTDVTDHDRIAAVSERGETIHEGPLAVHAVLRRRDHLELICVRSA